MTNHIRRGPRRGAKRRAAKKLRGWALRRPYLVAIASAVGSGLLKASINYWAAPAWGWLREFVRGVLQ